MGLLRFLIEIYSLAVSGLYVLTFPFSLLSFIVGYIWRKMNLALISIAWIQRLSCPRLGTNAFSRFGRVILTSANVHVSLGSALAGIALLAYVYQPYLQQFDGQYYVTFQQGAVSTAYAEEPASGSGVIAEQVPPIVTEIAVTPTPTAAPYRYYTQYNASGSATIQQPAQAFVPPTFTNTSGYQSPLRIAPKYISTPFSWGHPGIDMVADVGTPIYAASEGYITRAGWSAWGYGNSIEMDNGGGMSTLYAHLSKVNVTLGQKVDKSTMIGLVGSTGRSSGPHLHFEIHRNMVPFNPVTVFDPMKP
jgi:murein DD-endopeptidase MepM/ murein hydrolase activator NlpD